MEMEMSAISFPMPPSVITYAEVRRMAYMVKRLSMNATKPLARRIPSMERLKIRSCTSFISTKKKMTRLHTPARSSTDS